MASFTYGSLVNQRSTTINGAMTAVSPANGANLPVTDGTVFPTKGYALIDQELVHFDSVSGNNLVLNASDGRGSGGTVAAAHASLTTIYADVIVAAHFNELMTYSPNTLLTAKGDILTATAASTPSRLAVGSDGQVFVADSTQATGNKWLGNVAMIADTSVASSNSAIDFSSIPATYRHLRIVVSARSDSTGVGEPLRIRLNADSSSLYDSLKADINHNAHLVTYEGLNDISGYLPAVPCSAATGSLYAAQVISLPNYASASIFKTYHAEGGMQIGPLTTNLYVSVTEGMWKSTSPVNRITLFPASSSFVAASRITLYGEA